MAYLVLTSNSTGRGRTLSSDQLFDGRGLHEVGDQRAGHELRPALVGVLPEPELGELQDRYVGGRLDAQRVHSRKPHFPAERLSTDGGGPTRHISPGCDLLASRCCTPLHGSTTAVTTGLDM